MTIESLHCCRFVSLIALAIFAALAVHTDAQNIEYDQTVQLGAIGKDSGIATETDNLGNSYVLGMFEGTVDFDPGFGISNLTSGGEQDIYVQKLDADGNLLWARNIGRAAGYGRGYIKECNFDLDNTSNIYITGGFDGTIDFDPDAESYNLSSNTALGAHMFVVKISPDGNFIWAKSTSGYQGTTIGKKIAVGPLGSVYVTGSFSGTTDFDPGPSTLNHTSTGWTTGFRSHDAFMLKLNAGGDLSWVRILGGYGYEYCYDLCAGLEDDLFVTGAFEGTVDFTADPTEVVATSNGREDIFFLKLTPEGSLDWLKTVGGTASDVGEAIVQDASGSLYTTGRFSRGEGGAFTEVDFNAGAGVAKLVGEGSYLLKLESSGDFVSVRELGPNSRLFTTSIGMDSVNNLYIGGNLGWSGADFVLGEGRITIPGQYSMGDGFLLQINDSGEFNWVKVFGHSLADIRVVETDTVHLTGSFSGVADFDPGYAATELRSNGSTDAFFTKLIPDIRPPILMAIDASTVGPTNASAVIFNLTFNEDVLNFDNELDLLIEHDGSTHTDVTISDDDLYGGPGIYTVSVNGISGNGHFTVGIAPNSDIVDRAGNSIEQSDVTVTMEIDNIPPTVIVGSPSTPITNIGPVDFPVTYSGADTVNLTTDDLIIHMTGTALQAADYSYSVYVNNGTTLTPTITVENISGDGTFSVEVGKGTASDVAGNHSGHSPPSENVTVDNTRPGTTISVPSPTSTISGPVTFQIEYSDSTYVDLGPDDVSISGDDFHGAGFRGDITVLNGTSNSPIVVVNNILGMGLLGIRIAEGTASDAAGNTTLAVESAYPHSFATIDKIPPSVGMNGEPSVSLTRRGPVEIPLRYYGATVVNLTAEKVSLSTTEDVTARVTILNGATTEPTVLIDQIAGDGRLSYLILAPETASDAAGNVSGEEYIFFDVGVDNTPPETTLSKPSSDRTASGTVRFSIRYWDSRDFSDLSYSLSATDIVLNRTGTADGVISLSGDYPYFIAEISGITGDGALSISVPEGTATDQAGNMTNFTGPSAPFLVDNTPPVITLHMPELRTVEAGEAWVEPGAVATDDFDGAVEVSISGDIVESGGPVGKEYIIEYTAEDSLHNTATATRTVRVVDTTPPEIGWYGADWIDCNSGIYFNYEAFAYDNADGQVEVNYTGEVNTTVSGVYEIFYTATDQAGNEATQTRTVSVALPASIVYVSPPENGGSDEAGEGTESSPWATINRALRTVSGCATEGSPITIQLAPGTYREAVQLSPFVTIKGRAEVAVAETIIAPTVQQMLENRIDDQPTAVIAAEKSEMANLTVTLPATSGAGWRVLTVGNVSFDATNLNLDGSNVQGSVGILVSGVESSGSNITGCFIHNLEFGVRALESGASITRTTFESIEEDALFIVEPASIKGIESALVPNLGDVSLDDMEGGGGNIFVGGNSIGGNFINNRNSLATIQAEGNDFGTNDREEIRRKIGGNADFEPRYRTGETNLVLDIFIDVSESANAAPVTDAVVRLEPHIGLPTEAGGGRYVFKLVPFQSYVISVSATNYRSAQVSLTDADSSEPATVMLDADESGAEFSVISQYLTQRFNTLDLDRNGALDIQEIRAELPSVSQSQFDILDSNGDGQLSDMEVGAQVGEGEGEGETPGAGCQASKGKLVNGIKRSLSDIFLLSLAMIAMLAFGQVPRRL